MKDIVVIKKRLPVNKMMIAGEPSVRLIKKHQDDYVWYFDDDEILQRCRAHMAFRYQFNNRTSIWNDHVNGEYYYFDTTIDRLLFSYDIISDNENLFWYYSVPMREDTQGYQDRIMQFILQYESDALKKTHNLGKGIDAVSVNINSVINAFLNAYIIDIDSTVDKYAEYPISINYEPYEVFFKFKEQNNTRIAYFDNEGILHYDDVTMFDLNEIINRDNDTDNFKRQNVYRLFDFVDWGIRKMKFSYNSTTRYLDYVQLFMDTRDTVPEQNFRPRVALFKKYIIGAIRGDKQFINKLYMNRLMEQFNGKHANELIKPISIIRAKYIKSLKEFSVI